MMVRGSFASPLGLLTLASDGTHLTGLWLPDQKYFASVLPPDAPVCADLAVFKRTHRWLRAYFAGERLDWLPPLAWPQASLFRQAVWHKLLQIPYGQVTTYGALAQSLAQDGMHTSPRAVAGAVAHNPISIVVPCHRVVGAQGALTGYAGGLQAKKWLLAREGVAVQDARVCIHERF